MPIQYDQLILKLSTIDGKVLFNVLFYIHTTKKVLLGKSRYWSM
jgi:hypothetical protein